MWSIGDLKISAKQALNNIYWKAVLASFILSIVVGGASGSAGGSSSSSVANSVEDAASGDIFAFIISLLAAIVMILVLCAAGAIALKIFLLNPIATGCYRFFVLGCVQDANLNEIGIAFKEKKYMNVVKIMFFKDLYIFLWTLALIIPGIVKKYEYRMVPYLLSENPEIDMQEAFDLSRKMMDGEKLHAFWLDLSFIGWDLLSIFTCGILSVFYVNPYRNLTNGSLYLALRDKAINN